MTGGESGRSRPPAPCGPLRGRGRHEDEPELEGAAGQAARHAAAEPKTLSPGQACHASCARRGVSKNQLDTASRFQRWLPACKALPRRKDSILLIPGPGFGVDADFGNLREGLAEAELQVFCDV